jgi:hypothetical protein
MVGSMALEDSIDRPAVQIPALHRGSAGQRRQSEMMRLCLELRSTRNFPAVRLI